MRVILPAAVAAFVAAGATFAFAQTSAPAPVDATRYEIVQDGQRAERRAERMRERFNERLQKMKTELKLTPQQVPLFNAVETQLRKMGAERRAVRVANRDRFQNAELPDRLDLMSERATANAASMRELSSTVKPLWATLTAEQKEIVKKNMPRRGPLGGDGERRRG
ncbi:MAG: Spy/CpxP family protein refolding chaperone [Bosea sp. (in: a-proteobacteria)]